MSNLLWFDDNARRPFEEKVRRAVHHYHRKFGLHRVVCYVHPSLLKQGPQRVGTIWTQPKYSLPRDHYLVKRIEPFSHRRR
jgi:hypothetical protein